SVSAAVTQTVNPITTSTALIGSANPTTAGDPVTFTASVTPSNQPGPTGTATFTDDGTPLATVTMSSNTATYTTSGLATGKHTIAAVYNGDSTHSGSTSPAVDQTVTPIVTAVALATSPNPSTAGQAVTLTATVTGG